MEIVHQLHLWLVYRSVLVKEKVGNLKRDLTPKLRKRLGKSVEFKKYLHGICDAGSRLLF